jgi:hypothetical protein
MKRLLVFLVTLTLANSDLVRGQSSESKPLDKYPQLLIDVSESLINAAVRRSVERVEPVHELILEARVTGMARTVGKVRAELVPDPCRGSFYVVICGTSCSRSVGRQEGVLTHTNGFTSFEVGHLVSFDGKTICRACGPLFAQSEVCLLCATGLNGDPDTFFAQLAPFGFYQRKSEIESIVADRTGRRVADRLEEELTPSLFDASNALRQAVSWAKDHGVNVESLNFSTVPPRLQGRVRVADDLDPGPAPRLPANLDLGVRVHESLLNQTAKGLLGGSTWKISELIGAAGKGMNIFLREGRKDPPKDVLKNIEKLLRALSETPPTITFAEADPFTIRFTEEGFTVEAHVAKIEAGELSLGGTRVRAKYLLETKDQDVLIVRQGPIEFLPTEKKGPMLSAPVRLLAQAVAEELLKSRFLLGNLAMPAQLSQVPPLTPSRAMITKGWLVLGWKLRTS